MPYDQRFYQLEALRAMINLRIKTEIAFAGLLNDEKQSLQQAGKSFELKQIIYVLIREKKYEQLFTNNDFLIGLNWLKQVRQVSTPEIARSIGALLETLSKLFPDTDIFNKFAA